MADIAVHPVPAARSASSRPTRAFTIKICGVRTPEGAQAAVDAGADMLGFICYPPARRYLPPEGIAAILRVLRGRSAVQAVGVFVNQSVDEMNDLAVACGLDVIQLSGDEPVATLERLARPVIKAVRPAPGQLLGSQRSVDGAGDAWRGSAHAPARIGGDIFSVEAHRLGDTLQAGDAQWLRLAAGAILAHLPGLRALLLESPNGGWGGQGVVVDWSRARAIMALANRPPITLAGGLTPENVAAAIRAVGPDGVDVSSGVERDGAQDPARIAAFVAAARKACGHDEGG